MTSLPEFPRPDLPESHPENYPALRLRVMRRLGLPDDGRPWLSDAISPDMNEYTSAILEQFVTRASDDTAKTDLELIHEPCGTHVCDIEATDTLLTLVNTALGHEETGCPSYNDEDEEEAR